MFLSEPPSPLKTGETEPMTTVTKPQFVGKYFFSFKNEELQWQGQIISKVSEGVYRKGTIRCG
jgi:hypothetical protein